MSDTQAMLDALSRFPTLRAGVLGDLMADRFIYGSAARLSPEAPVPVVRIERRLMSPGGAANAGVNVLSMGAALSLFGVLGDDEDGRAVRLALAGGRADLRGVILERDRPSTVKTRVIAQGQQIVRFDEEVTTPVDDNIAARLFDLLAAQINELNILIISDYAKGLLTEDLLKRVLALCQSAGVKTIADPKPLNAQWYAGIDVVKPNLGEALRLADRDGRGAEHDEMEAVCRKVRERVGARDVIVTAGARGMYVLAGEQFTHVAAVPREVFDVAGAGDTTLAAVALGLAAGCDLPTAAQLGNVAGSIAVGKLGTAAVSAAELRTEIEAHYGQA